MKVFVDNSRFLEAVSEIADQLVAERFGASGYIDDENEEETRYSDEAQDFFNEKYDEIESLLNNTLGVFSNIDLEDEA